MKWPWRRRAEAEHRLAQDARERLESVMDDWPPIYEMAGTLRVASVRNHITEKAFALRERSR